MIRRNEVAGYERLLHVLKSILCEIEKHVGRLCVVICIVYKPLLWTLIDEVWGVRDRTERVRMLIVAGVDVHVRVRESGRQGGF